MDEFTKKKVKRAMLENTELTARVVIQAIRFNQKHRLLDRKMRKNN
jgi:hypothetical protein